MTAPGLSCVLVDDHLIFLQLLAGVLGTQPGLDVLATATTAAEAIEACRSHRPDLLILDLCLPDQPGEVVAEALAELRPDAGLIVLSAQSSEFVCSPALQPMLLAVIDKVDAFARLNQQIGQLLQRAPAQQPANLTGREQQVLKLLGQGHSNQRIAEILTVSVATVITHRRNICFKLNIKGGDLVRFATLRQLEPT
jgi:DNA-binding NarL/FixJ family response regulator